MLDMESAAAIRRYKRSSLHFHIFVSDPCIVQVACNGRLVENWQELQVQAWKVVEPFVRARWSMHWLDVQDMAQKALKPGGSLVDLIPCTCIIAPSMVYPCPSWLAELAVVNTERGAGL